MKKQKGFSLIELLIVVAIILIIAAIAVPNLLRSRMAANETSAAASLRTIATANTMYLSSCGRYAPGLTDMAAGATTCAAGEGLLGADLSAVAAPTKAGYVFTYGAPGPGTGFQAVANPVTTGSSGNRFFCIDHSGTVVTAAAAITVATDGSVCTGTPL